MTTENTSVKSLSTSLNFVESNMLGVFEYRVGFCCKMLDVVVPLPKTLCVSLG